MAAERPDGQPSLFVRQARRLVRLNRRRSWQRSLLGGLAVASVAFTAFMLAAAAMGPATAATGRPWAAGAALVLGATAAVTAVSRAGLRARRRRDAEIAVVSRMDAVLGWEHLAVTAWEWAHGTIASPFGPAILSRADRLSRRPELSDRAVEDRIAPPVRGVRASVALLAVAAWMGTAPAWNLVHELTSWMHQEIAAWRARQAAQVPLDASQAAFLKALSRALREEGLRSRDPAALEAARELERVMAANATPESPFSSPVGSPDQRPGLPGLAGAPGAAWAIPPAGGAVPGGTLPADRSWAEQGYGAGLPWSERLALLMQLASMGEISPQAADRAAQLAALLARDGAGSSASTAWDSDGGAGAATPQEGAGDRRQASSSPPGQGDGRSQPARQTPPAPAQPGTSADPGRASSRLPGDRPPDQGAPGAAAAGRETEPRRAGAPARPDEGKGLSGAARRGPGAPREAADTRPSDVPGTTPGRLQMPAPGPWPDGSGAVPVPSHPQLGPGSAVMLPGPPGPPPRGTPAVPWEQGPPGQDGTPVQELAPLLERVPVEYRDAVRRYFEAVAGQGG
ncbi:hypothetical protein U7230_11525 [Carboxydochorda subterranea]|uniref:Uncharacterized protein n=1 Tax=Carboxydichorda subterranea TaxID=3109565 RepID=A0ABZ1BVS0_9FIRM|nr:hypothetical protein [Limnochorda sp. L945t]WRP16710.1 hypothetical protein U7230_11525 [Limnochorda sp. L945t]